MGNDKQDSRFTRIQKDPRFRRPNKRQTQIEIDSRFASMLTDKDFDTVQRVDKYGRKPGVATRRTMKMEDFYHLKEPEEQVDDISLSESEISAVDEQEDDIEVDELEKRLTKEEQEDEDEESAYKSRMERMARIARGAEVLSSSDEEFLNEDDDDAEIEDGIMRIDGTLVKDLQEEDFEDLLDTENVPKGDCTCRFAVVNMDWDNITAQDLHKVFDGFKPVGGLVKSVIIYPSEFGKERLAKEEREGPPAEIFGGREGSDTEGESGDEVNNDEELIKNDDGEEFDVLALRKYQLERLRYYFAVVECDSVRTAEVIFNECDGHEYEFSSATFDLRYIPDDVTFDEDEPRDKSFGVAEEYKPREFTTHVLQLSKPKLTWDEDDPVRKAATRIKFTEDDLRNMDFDAYLASESEESEDEEALKKKYKELLASLEAAENEENEDGQGDMEVTFTPGLSETTSKLLERKKEKETRKDETVFQKYLRERKEKKKAKRQQTGDKDGDALVSDGEVDQDIQADPFFQDAFGDEFNSPDEEVKHKKTKKSKKRSADQDEAEKREQAELELLMMDENTEGLKHGKKHFEYEEIVKREKKSKSKKGRKRKQAEEAIAQDDFKIDLQDSRFDALYSSSQFALDPSSSKFKKTKAMDSILKERRRRKNVDEDIPE